VRNRVSFVVSFTVFQISLVLAVATIFEDHLVIGGLLGLVAAVALYFLRSSLGHFN
jgi:uncharacterized membrane protein